MKVKTLILILILALGISFSYDFVSQKVHAASSSKNPVKQGLWGMFEVFFTTICFPG